VSEHFPTEEAELEAMALDVLREHELPLTDELVFAVLLGMQASHNLTSALLNKALSGQ